MHRPSSVEPFTPDPSPPLHPGLTSALDNMDMHLDDELERYRRQRYRQTGQKKRLAPPPPSMISSRPSELRPELRAELRSGTPAPSLPYVEHPTGLNATGLETSDLWDSPVSAANLAASNFNARQMVQEPRWQTPQELSQSQSQPIEGYLDSSKELLKSLSQPETPPIKRKTTLLDTLLTPLGVGSMLLLLLSSVSVGYVLLHPASIGLVAALSDHSSENPTQGSGAIAPNQSLSPDLSTDEFMDVNLNTLSQLPRNAQLRPTTVVTVPQATVPQTSSLSLPSPAASPSVTTTSSAIVLPASPTLSTPSPRASTAASPTASPRASTSASSRTSTPASPRASTPASPQASRPAAKPAATVATTVPATAPLQTIVVPARPPQAAVNSPLPTSPPVTISEAPPPVTPRYYVVTEYTGDPSLAQARQIISDAYVRNFSSGTKVQMGSFGDEASAQQLAQQLQQRGVPAQVYKP